MSRAHLPEWRKAKELAVGALFIALGVLLPFPAHIILPGQAGQTLLPMHLPVLIAAFLVSPPIALIVGALTPIVSSLTTGMPPFPFVIVMFVELSVLGLSAALLMKARLPLWLIAPLAILCRCAATLLIAVYFGKWLGIGNGVSFAIGLAGLLKGLPGIIAQLILAPGIAYLLLMRQGQTKTSPNEAK